MGREIRMVPPNWEHPKNERGNYDPMLDDSFENALKAWVHDYKLWAKGEHPDQPKDCTFSEWDGGPPQEDWYRPEFTEEPTWFQVYETISEGTPVTPPFKTKAELVTYLVENGDFYDQRRGDGGWTKENAEGFVEREWAPTGIFNASTGELKTARDGA